MTDEWQFVTFITTYEKLIIVTLISVSELVQPFSNRVGYLLELAPCTAFFISGLPHTDAHALESSDTSSPCRLVDVFRNTLLRWYLTVSRDRADIAAISDKLRPSRSSEATAASASVRPNNF